MLSVVLPYFTSIIVRAFSWMRLLGEHGLVNGVLLATGLISAPLPLTYNRLGVLIGRAREVLVDWPSAALMSLTLLVVSLALYAVYYRVIDIRRLIGERRAMRR